MTIKARLMAGLVTVIIFTVILGLWALLVQDRLGASIHSLEIQSRKATLVADLQLATQKLLMPANDYIITGKNSYAEDFKNLCVEAEKIFQAIRLSGHFNNNQMATIDRAESLFTAVKGAGEEIFRHNAQEKIQADLMEAMDYKYADPMIKELDALSDVIRLASVKTQQQTNELRRVSRISVIAAVTILTIILLTAGFIQLRAISRALDVMILCLKEIAEGKGDLTQRINITSKDELGTLSHWFNKFTDQLQGMMQEVSSASQNVSQSAQHIANTSSNFHAFATIQFRAIDDTSQSTERLNVSIQGIANDSETLLDLSARATSSAREISASIASVANLTENLDGVADSTLNAVNMLTSSFTDVGASMTELSEKAASVVDSTIKINAVAGEINAYAHDQAVRAEEIKNEAFTIGLETVKKTRERMEKIRSEVAATAEVMSQLGDMSTEISRIVGMIGEITNKTKMLALNASILAAQSGTDGKGFSVVAEEVKALAAKTANSTDEISAMIKHVQDRTVIAINAAKRSSEEVEEGVRLSLDAETVLGTIIGKTENSLQNAMKVARAAEDQTLGLSAVTDSIQQIQQMIERISCVVVEQKNTSKDILAASEGVHSYAREARGTIAAQSDEANRISEMFLEIHSNIRMIFNSTKEQQNSSTEIVMALETVSAKARENIALATGLDKVVNNLDSQAQLLLGKVSKFNA